MIPDDPTMPDAARNPRELIVDNPTGKNRNEMQAQLALDVITRGTMAIRESMRRFFPDADLTSMANEARELARKVVAGDRSHFANMICMQALALDAEAAELSRRANTLLDSKPDLALSMLDVGIRMRQVCINSANCLSRMDIETKRAGGRARGRASKAGADR